MSDFLKSNLNDLVAESLRSSPAAAVVQQAEPAKKKAPLWAQLLNVAGPMADGLSTMHVMNQSGPMADGSGYVSGVESNPLYGKNATAGKVLGIKGGQAALSVLMSHFFPKIAKPLGIANGALGGLATGLNMNTANKIKKLRGTD